MNGAPDWQDGECCFRCRTQFTLVARKHHCRNCGNIFCAKCSSQQIPIPRLNIDKAVRVCDGCYEKISNKNTDPLTLALNPEDKEPVKKKSSSSKSASSSNTKSSANASAPSEQELKEEEELQLALALSLSETPTKVSFPDCRQFEEPSLSVQPTPTPTTVASTNPAPVVASTFPPSSATPTTTEQTIYSLTPEKSIPQQQQQQPVQVQAPPPPFEYYLQDRDREVFNYVFEVQSTLEIFNNRLNACKLRNRPIANDSAIQSLFLKLNTEFQPKLTEYIKAYEDERAGYERLQDKLSQIADARAALDDLREEHQEKMRQLAAEAEKQRQSQLATKLEAMRQKKSQMMQYQRELALQRIKEQEMLLQQPQPPSLQQPSQGYQPPTVASVQQQQQQPLPGPSMDHVHQLTGFNNPTVPPILSNNNYAHSHPSSSYPQQAPSYQPVVSHEYPTTAASTQQAQYTPSQQQSTQQPQVFQSYAPQPAPDYSALAKFEQQYLPKPQKPDEDAPLISFDD